MVLKVLVDHLMVLLLRFPILLRLVNWWYYETQRMVVVDWQIGRHRRLDRELLFVLYPSPPTPIEEFVSFCLGMIVVRVQPVYL